MLPYVQAGLAVVTPEYRLTPDARAPAAVEDARAALEWILENGTDYGLDVTRIAVIGVSAGGHLALMLGFTEPGRDRIAGVVDLYGPTDLTELVAGPARRGWASQWIGPPPGRSERARRLSPIDRLTAGAPPVLIIHSAQDEVVPYAQATRLRTALRSAAVPVELVTLPRAKHGFMTDEEQTVVRRAVLAFLREIGLLGDRDVSEGTRGEASTR